MSDDSSPSQPGSSGNGALANVAFDLALRDNGWSSRLMLRRYGASARSARARRTYDRIMTDRP